MPHERTRFGTEGEEVAADYLRAKRYRVIDQNARTVFGELDLVCLHRREVVFVEVKTRRSHAFGTPEAAVTKLKQQHLIRSAYAYLAAHPKISKKCWRIDVVAITWGDPPEIIHIVAAVGDDM
ncbi:MAG: YraN family protein [Candidatus Uhrbacteria bacterium]